MKLKLSPENPYQYPQYTEEKAYEEGKQLQLKYDLGQRAREQVAKLCYQYAGLIDDKDIDNHWESLILTGKNERWLVCADQILSIEELAVVDRDAKLPAILVDPALTRVEIIRQFKEILCKDGWIKEIKE